MKNMSDFPKLGVASEIIQELVTPRRAAPVTKIGMVGVGLKMHFVWAEASRLYREACGQVRGLLDPEHFELLAPEEAFESPDALLASAGVEIS